MADGEKIPQQAIINILDHILGPEIPFKQKTPDELQKMLDERIRQEECTLCRGVHEDGTCAACGRELDGPSSIHEW